MKELDQELREALGRREAPSGFEERVLARIQREQTRAARPVPVPWWRGFRFPALALAAALLLLAVGGISVQRYRQSQETARGQKAREQVLLALRITGQKLVFARNKVLDHTLSESREEGR